MGYLGVLSVSRGRVAGLSAVLGISVGLAVYMVAAAFGITEALLVYPPVFVLLRWTGVAFILWLAVEAWRGEADPTLDEAPHNGNSGYFWRGLLTNLLNPKAAVFYVLLLPGFIAAGRASALTQALVLGSIHLLVSIAVHGSIVLGGARLGRIIASTPIAANPAWLRRGFALSLAGVALWLAISTAT